MKRTIELQGSLPGEAVRYGIAGVGVAGLYGAVLLTASAFLGVQAQAANALGFLAALAAGYIVHSRWTFEGHGDRTHLSAVLRYLGVNLAGYALNALWVWILVDLLERPVAFSLVPIVTLTPALMFALNRSWTFALRA